MAVTRAKQREKLSNLSREYTTCLCSWPSIEWQSSVVLDADFEEPLEPASLNCARNVYMVARCSDCSLNAVFTISFESHGVSGMQILVEALKSARNAIGSEISHTTGSRNVELLREIRDALRACWLHYHPRPILP